MFKKGGTYTIVVSNIGEIESVTYNGLPGKKMTKNPPNAERLEPFDNLFFPRKLRSEETAQKSACICLLEGIFSNPNDDNDETCQYRSGRWI